MAANADLIRNLYAAFGRGDVETILDNVDPEITWSSNCEATTIPWGGTRHGAAGAASFFQALGDNLDFEAFEPREFFEADGAVIVVGHTRARFRRNDHVFSSDWVHVFKIANGRVAQFREFYDTAAVMRAMAA
jgi:hypothetical protein